MIEMKLKFLREQNRISQDREDVAWRLMPGANRVLPDSIPISSISKECEL